MVKTHLTCWGTPARVEGGHMEGDYLCDNAASHTWLPVLQLIAKSMDYL